MLYLPVGTYEIKTDRPRVNSYENNNSDFFLYFGGIEQIMKT
jgi:hypothetical protein